MIEQRVRLLQEVIDKKRKLSDLVSILWVSRQTLSTWKAQYLFGWVEALLPKKPWPKIWSHVVNRTPIELEDYICNLACKHWERWPQLLSDLLEEEDGVIIHPTTIWRILKRRKERYGYGYRKLKKKKKLYTLDVPGRELQVDVSFPWWYQKKCLVYSAIDDCSRYVFSDIHTGRSDTGTIQFLTKLIVQSPFRIQAIRTDQWSEFSQRVTRFLKDYNIQHIRNPPYTPQYNGKIERFHRTYKEQARIRWDYRWSNEEVNYQLQLYLQYYNNRKKHRWLGMNGLTPVQKLRECWIII